jgi:hypothetical protein
LNFLKIAGLAIDFSQEQDFWGANSSQLTMWENMNPCGKRTLSEQSSVDSEHRWSSLTLPPQKWRSGVGAICSGENPAPERNPGLKRTRMDAIFKMFNLKMNLKLKINVIRKYFELQNHPAVGLSHSKIKFTACVGPGRFCHINNKTVFYTIIFALHGY